jgi:DNA polymerase III epsilon subunit
MTRYIFLDTEKTGLDPHSGGHRIIDLACIEYKDATPTGNVFNLKINPEGKKSVKKAFQVHGILDKELVEMPTFRNIYAQFIEFIKDAHLVIFNAPFDLKFLNAELNRINYPSTVSDICSEVTCAMEFAKKKFGVRKISQDAACLRYGIDISSRTKHSALLDSSLCAQLFFKLLDESEVPLKSTPQQKKHTPTKAISIPRAFRSIGTDNYIQLNFCKNPECENFGVIAKNPTYKDNGELKRGLGNEYKLTWSDDKSEHLLTCKLCGHSTTMIHNRCFDAEVTRLSTVYEPIEPTCPNKAIPADPKSFRYYYIPHSPENRRGTRVQKPRCKNRDKGIYTHSELYKLDGKTQPDRVVEHVIKKPLKKGGKPVTQVVNEERLGSQLLTCRECDTKFAVKVNPANRHYRELDNVKLFKDLMNKDIINRMMDKHGLGAKVIYDKINFFYEQALAFDHYHSQMLDHAVATKTLNLSSDRQFYLSNWGDHNMPKPTPIVNTSTVDNDTGFVFVSNVNFDFTSDYIEINKEHREKKEQEKYPYYRRYAQYVLSNDDVNMQAPEAERNIELQMPPKGLLVQQTYSVLAHFVLLKEKLKYADRIHLYADNDSGIKLALGAVFCDWIAHHKLYAFQISADKSGSAQYLDDTSSEHFKNIRDELKKENSDITKEEIKAALWREQLSNRVRVGNAKSEWIINPNKESRLAMMLPLGDVNNMNPKLVERSLVNASLHGVDNWFQILRRHINFLERPVTSATNSKRWNAYAGYNPEWMAKLIEIKRVYFNYCMTNERTLNRNYAGKHKPTPTTPAMRLGLTEKVYTCEELLSFSLDKVKIEEVFKNKV